MAWVPGGPFIMGLDRADADTIARHLGFKTGDDLWAWDSYPKRKVHVDGFFIDQHEATVGSLAGNSSRRPAIAANHKETSRHFDQDDKQELPAGEITWEEAKAYAQVGGPALPTDAEWEKAARGTDGRLYPWGNDPPTLEHGHFGDKKDGRRNYTSRSAASPKVPLPTASWTWPATSTSGPPTGWSPTPAIRKPTR